MDGFSQTLWQKFADFAMGLLPLSPVAEYVEYFSSLPYLGYINWFIPVGDCMKVMSAWLVCVGAYYLISIILRWTKMIA